MDERVYYLAFSNAPGIGAGRFALLLKKFGTAQNAWSSTEEEFRVDGIGEKIFLDFDRFRKQFDFKKYQANLTQKNIWFISLRDKDYPQSLRRLQNPPIVIFGKGDKSCLKTSQAIGVVGTRKVTSYGKDVTESLVSQLTIFGFNIISGMALGVDAIAHASCLDNKGKTIAVLGNGVDLPFPRENQSLYQEILEKGGVIISEYPPSVNPTKGSFLARNRIIAALSLGVLIPEAAEGSGSLTTAAHAKKLGKPIFAVPGPITSSVSDGTSQLLQEGAVLVRSAQDIIKVLNINVSLNKKNNTRDFSKLNLSKDELRICKMLENENLAIDDIFQKTKIGIRKLSILLSEMEMKGIVKRESGKFTVSQKV
jgi:DNA processing protein